MLKWDETLALITPAEAATFPIGFEFVNIWGTTVYNGSDYCTNVVLLRDHCPFGLPLPLINHPQAELITKLRLTW